MVLAMTAVRAHFENGAVVLDEPLDLPDGTPLTVVPLYEGDNLDDEERAELHTELRASLEEAKAGQLVDFDEVLAELRSRL
jgi:hypothetical protein